MEMQLARLLKKRVEAVTPETRLTVVAQKMIAQRTNALPVCREGKLVGALSVRDLIWRTTSEGRDPTLATVSEVMNQKVVRCFGDDDSREAIRVMRKKRVTQIWVTTRKGEFLGTLSLGDLPPIGAAEKSRGVPDEESLNKTE